ncbi:MAG: DUF6635 family protein [Gammaproteobacteria bacterium]
MQLADNHKLAPQRPRAQVSNEHRQLILKAVNAGIETYIDARKAKVPTFVANHFSFQGALKLHRKALGKNLYKAPLNILWLTPLAISKVCSWLLNKAGAGETAQRIDNLPSGFQTDVQKEINWLIYTELLELPYQQETRTSTKDALLEAILQDSELAGVIDAYLTEIHNKSTNPAFRRALEKNLKSYASTRTAAAELAGNLITLSSSYIAFHKALPGALTSGSATAAAIAKKIAIAQFWLGPTLGSWYYSLFPVAASTGLVIATTGAIMAGLGLITAFAGIITDPLQAKLGFHQKRLNKFIDALAAEMRGDASTQVKIKELYIVRVLDILDFLMTALRG